MTTVYLVPDGSDSAPGAQDGDFLLRKKGEQVEVGRMEGPCTWLATVDASVLPVQLDDVTEAQEAPQQEQLLIAVRGIESAEVNRGG